MSGDYTGGFGGNRGNFGQQGMPNNMGMNNPAQMMNFQQQQNLVSWTKVSAKILSSLLFDALMGKVMTEIDPESIYPLVALIRRSLRWILTMLQQ